LSKETNYKTKEPCVSCKASTENGNCFHHIKTRASGGKDVPENMIPTCKQCHAMFHNHSTNYMASKYSSVMEWLLSNGWYICELTGKWRNPKA